jgi:cytochrome c556
MFSGRVQVAAVAGIAYAAVLVASCSSPKPAAPPAAATTGRTEMKAVVSVKELMRFTIDPISDNIFDAVTYDVTRKGAVDTFPKTDEDWEKVKIGAVTLAEAIYLLKLPRPWTPAGDVNNSTGPNPPELSPTQMQAKLDADPVLWDAKIQALRNVALEVLEIANKKDVKELFAAGEDLDKACESCHLEYWYPGDRKAVEEDERQRARFEKGEKKPGKARK